MVSRFRCTGRIAFAGQQAWIQSGSLRDNILFGLPFDKEKYDRVVDACCLIQDFAELPDGDMTFIGE
jgi:ABC-type multidrug transport system fused ATPase/permease subunit